MPSIKQLEDQGRSLVDDQKALVLDESRTWADKRDEYENRDKDIKAVREQLDALKAVDGDPFAAAGVKQTPQSSATPRSLGEHFANSVGQEGFSTLKATTGYTVSAGEFGETGFQNAATDPQTLPGSLAPATTEFDTNVVRGYRRALVSDLLGEGALGPNSNAVSYPVEGVVEGGFTAVAEGGQKPQLHIGDPTIRTDALKKIAGFWDTSDEMVEDIPFWVSEINNRGLYLLGMEEERQLMTGSGSSNEILGVLNRSGVQTITQGASEPAADAIFRGMTAVQTATGLVADGIIINPVDYMALRLGKDSNNQYYGGGYFSGLYGVGGVQFQPPIWGLNTIVSAAVAPKTVAIGAFKAATTVYRKGGVRVESTNSDLGKFTKNLITTRIEERAALAVRVPAGVVKATLL